MLLQQAGRLIDAIEGRPASTAEAKAVVEVFGAVDAEADQEAVIAEEFAPGVVQEEAVGLQGVVDAFAARMLLLQSHDLAIKIEPHERGLASVPGELREIGILRGDILADELLQEAVGHCSAGLLVEQLFLVQVVAVGAVQVAQRADRLRHHVEGALQSLRF